MRKLLTFLTVLAATAAFSSAALAITRGVC
jgi:hypothetical protein